MTEQVDTGDLIHIDSLILHATDVSTASRGYLTGKAITVTLIGSNRAAVIDAVFDKKFQRPPLSPKIMSLSNWD